MSSEIVDPLVGPISSTGTGGSGSLTDRGEAYDFSIGSLGFRLASTDETPYIRSTAQFRKEQYDASPTVGDQSLVGWWMRGQMSFHGGAGIKYYEVLDGEVVLNRYSSSVGVDPRIPGEVALLPEMETVNAQHLRALADNRAGRSEPLAGITDAGSAVLIDGGTTTTLSPSTAATVYDVTSGGGGAYYATGNGVEAVPATGTTLSLISAGDGTVANPEHVGVWWAKNRLWTVNGSGQWHTVPARGGAIGSSTLVWDSGLTSAAGDWSLTGSPAAVFVARGASIFAITVNSDGSVPLVDGGVTVAELPNDETVQGLDYALGYLIVATDKGIRVGVTSGTDVVMGPLTLEGVGNSVAVEGSTALVGTDDGLMAVDLTHPIDELTFAWFKWASNPGVVAGSSAGRYLLTSTGILRVSTSGPLATSGQLVTGFHRFGTLEPKLFHSVRIRIGGTGGSISVLRVDSNGSETSLLTVTPTGFSGDPITLRLPAPAEMVGLKFILDRDDTDPAKGPILHGYQLRAQPAPVRQRLLRVPLLVQDVERNRHGVNRGREGRAWAQLAALEQLESDHAVVSFRDHRTGEAGQAYIDEIEFRGDTPVVRQDGGFGGVAYVTLRKVT